METTLTLLDKLRLEQEQRREEIREETTCLHRETRLVYCIYKNGARHYGHQCERCGRWTESVKKASLSLKEQKSSPEFDESIREQWDNWKKAKWETYQTQYHEYREKQSRAWWEAYTAYLETAEWRDKRNRVLARDGYLCQACLRRKATQVHHLTYDHVLDEPLFDLVAVCSVCHKHLHGGKQR